MDIAKKMITDEEAELKIEQELMEEREIKEKEKGIKEAAAAEKIRQLEQD